MLNKENKELCEKVFKKYDFPHQLIKLAEECSELSAAIARVVNKNDSDEATENLIEEFVDVLVVQEQFLQYWGCYSNINVAENLNARAKAKLERALYGKDSTDKH